VRVPTSLFRSLVFPHRIVTLQQSFSSITKVRADVGIPSTRSFHDLTRPIPLEQYHSTPETQDAASYTHPEDYEHFSHHEAIELKEIEREAIYQGISMEEAIGQHAEPAPNEQPPAESAKVDGEEVPKKFERQIPPEEQDPVIRFRQAKAESEAHGEWGSGDSGYKPPNSPSEKMRKNLPYKVMSYFVFDEPLLEVDMGAFAVQVPPELG
jgi:hypothetical protein